MPTKTPTEWLSVGETRQMLGLSYGGLAKLASTGRIGKLQIPGVAKVMYRREDVEALVLEGTVPASTGRELVEI